MRNLVLIFLRFGHIILFLFLELVCLYLIVNYNRKQKEIWANSSNIFMGYGSEVWNDWTNYWYLKDKMDVVAAENAKLKEKLINFGLRPTVERDSLNIPEYRYQLIAANVINNSVDRPNNHITLDKGTKDGIKPDMGVISDNGIVGIIRNVNADYAQASSILHRRSFISAGIKRTGAYGDLRWIGSNPRYANLIAIENYQEVLEGDTIVTTGFSTNFPPGIQIGTVVETSLPEGSNFHNIKVLLGNDFGSLRYVYIVKNFKQEQQLELERATVNE